MLSNEIKKKLPDRKGLNCAETILYTANEVYNLNLDKEALKLCAGFGGGIGIGDKCGALIASVMVLSKLFVNNNAHENKRIKILTRELLNVYNEKMGDTNCAGLRRTHWSKEMGCNDVILKAAEVLEQIVERETNTK